MPGNDAVRSRHTSSPLARLRGLAGGVQEVCAEPERGAAGTRCVLDKSTRAGVASLV